MIKKREVWLSATMIIVSSAPGVKGIAEIILVTLFAPIDAGQDTDHLGLLLGDPASVDQER